LLLDAPKPHTEVNKMHTKKPASGFPRGWQIGGESTASAREHHVVRRSVRRRSRSIELPTAATGHVYTRGEGIVLGYAPTEVDQLPGQPPQSRCQGTLIPAPHSRRIIQERIGLRFDPQVYPCEYVSKRRRSTTHELLAFSTLLKINTPSIPFLLPLPHPSLAGLCGKYTLPIGMLPFSCAP